MQRLSLWLIFFNFCVNEVYHGLSLGHMALLVCNQVKTNNNKGCSELVTLFLSFLTSLVFGQVNPMLLFLIKNTVIACTRP